MRGIAWSLIAPSELETEAREGRKAVERRSHSLRSGRPVVQTVRACQSLGVRRIGSLRYTLRRNVSQLDHAQVELC